ncbi:hypothetical protein GCM10010912_58320 [Paenibacillus albidus]|uniref:Uncharacterized protein n=1 Tax=Paenibacillus albidus TaxID=2041023 RepID=A0A917FW14_9BACL|nr:hypothetical protein GCM10010912_58320 [Paenibacillus albidus]
MRKQQGFGCGGYLIVYILFQIAVTSAMDGIDPEIGSFFAQINGIPGE